ncbi:hypothetical protein JOD62_001772 [Microbacterium keratanolyticum]|uniref:Uncharacterized protein n=1 Tax=Microbacterium keratanolyticum TaxID=67574 RepID=A0A9W6HRH1_9MICO|nr:hypothetical protein [Microbacterium keratanolyticum]MBM7469224.1 hypothetical protein [Microbacterium keratanolyticum]GLK01304.1 hypothetical protein GCM10017596_10190 [Microbacterium keratanolyticum]
MTSEQSAGGADAAAPAAAAPPSAPPRWSPRRWARAVNDRVPTKWIATICTLAFLGATAAFGGAAEVAKPAIPELSAGQMFLGAELEMTVVSAELADERSGSGVSPAHDGDDRVLTVVLDVVNRDEEARTSYGYDAARGITLVDVETRDVDETTSILNGDASVARIDEPNFNPYLQPNVPVRLILSWQVAADTLHDGDEIRLRLPTAVETVGTMVVSGEYWTDLRTGAYVTVTVDDIGLGTAYVEATP